MIHKRPFFGSFVFGAVYNCRMNEGPVGSFLRFFLGFMLFISISFGVTIAVNVYASKQGAEQQTAAALQAMLGE